MVTLKKKTLVHGRRSSIRMNAGRLSWQVGSQLIGSTLREIPDHTASVPSTPGFPLDPNGRALT